LQYGLFLKGIGLTLEQSLEFWHREFVQRAGEEGWKKKNYAYNIQYNYGQAGRRVSYNPYNCQKIISLPTNPGDDHGCPFRSLAQSDLSAMIGDMPERKKILKLAIEEKAYTEACVAFYRAVRGAGSGQLLESHTLHPNQYYLASRQDAETVAHGGSLMEAPAQTSIIADNGYGQAELNETDFSRHDEDFEDIDPDAFLSTTSNQNDNSMVVDESAAPAAAE
jgi:hypothetical protein